jgi:peptidoglycan/xylan/chitin deacetylase (PgdA/CDA1 family)
MSWLVRHRTVLSLRDFAQRHRKGDLPDDAVALTFDDGYACTLEVAAPLLDSLALPATLFVPAALPGRSVYFWWDELQHIVLEHSGLSLSLAGRRFELGTTHRRDRRWPRARWRRTPRQAAFHAIWSWLRPQSQKAIDNAMMEARQQSPAVIGKAPRLMTPAEIGQLARFGIDVGSHAMNHVSLPGLPSSLKQSEVVESIDACQALTGVRPATFSYPFGDVDKESASFAKQVGFDCACTIEARAVSRSDDPFLLPRVAVRDCGAQAFALHLAIASMKQAGPPVGG